MYSGLWENVRERLIAAYAPDAASPIGRLIAEADALEAEKKTFQNQHTAAREKVRQLEKAVLKPRVANVNPGAPESAEWERQAAELKEARATEAAIGYELSSRSTRVEAIKQEIAAMLQDITIDAKARERERERVLRA